MELCAAIQQRVSQLPQPVQLLLQLFGAVALIAKVGLPLWDLLTRLTFFQKSPNWTYNKNNKNNKIFNNKQPAPLTCGANGERGAGWALITGASTGMGREYAMHLAVDKGMNVIIIADPPTEKELDAVEDEILKRSGLLSTNKSHSHGHSHPVNVIKIVADLLDESVYAEKIYPAIAAVLPNISVLINNVGMCLLNRFDRASIESDMKMFTLNVVPMIRLTKHVLPHMKKARRGYIVSMASLSGDIPTPFLAIYGATKTFIRSFSAAIREELRVFSVSEAKRLKVSPSLCCDFSVTVPMPFGVLTPLYEKIGQQSSTGAARRDELSVTPRAAVTSIVKKIGSNREHYGHDGHDVIGTLLTAFLSREKAGEAFKKALVECVPCPPGCHPKDL